MHTYKQYRGRERDRARMNQMKRRIKKTEPKCCVRLDDDGDFV